MLRSITNIYRGIDYTIATSYFYDRPRTYIGSEEVDVSYTSDDLKSIEDALKLKIDEIIYKKSQETLEK